MRTWPIYLRMQNDLAYGEGFAAHVWSEAEVAAWQRWKSALPLEDGSSVLFIGPGGPNEVAALTGTSQLVVTALTAHKPEAIAIMRAIPSARVAVGDMHDMPFATASFDYVFASNVMEHALAPYVALLESRRVLMDGGRSWFILPSFAGDEGGQGPFHLHCLTQEVWSELLRKTGHELERFALQPGGVNPNAQYLHFHCRAVAPPAPHDRILAELVRAKEINP